MSIAALPPQVLGANTKRSKHEPLMTDFAHARKIMVDNQLRTSNVTDHRVLAAMGAVPREMFVPPARRPIAYFDETHPLEGAAGRYLPAPAPFAKLVQLAEIKHTDNVLDLGAGNGYSAAVLANLADKVVAVEPDSSLAAAARSNLASLGIGNVEIAVSAIESFKGGAGVYDVIFLEGSVETVPESLFGQLKPEGRLVALIAEPGRPAVAHLFARSGKGIAARPDFNASLPPLSRPPVRDEFVF